MAVTAITQCILLTCSNSDTHRAADAAKKAADAAYMQATDTSASTAMQAQVAQMKALALYAGEQADVALKNYYSARDSVTQEQKNIDKQLAAMQKLANATQIQSGTAKDSLAETRNAVALTRKQVETYIDTDRAVIKSYDPDLKQFVAGIPILATVTYENVGKVAATDISIASGAYIYQGRPTRLPEPKVTEEDAVLVPNAHHSAGQVIAPMTIETVNGIKSGIMTLAFRTRICYSDGFGAKWEWENTVIYSKTRSDQEGGILFEKWGGSVYNHLRKIQATAHAKPQTHSHEP